MGIYSDGKIYGVSLVSPDGIIYSNKYPYSMGILEFKEVADLYSSLSEETKIVMKVSFWLKSSTTYEPTIPSEFMHWYISDISTLEELFKRTA